MSEEIRFRSFEHGYAKPDKLIGCIESLFHKFTGDSMNTSCDFFYAESESNNSHLSVVVIAEDTAGLFYTFYDRVCHENSYGLASCSDVRLIKDLVDPNTGCWYSRGGLYHRDQVFASLNEFFSSPFVPPKTVVWVEYDDLEYE